MEDRYARQTPISGWDQTRLSAARVTIVGSGPLAGAIAWSLAALGVGCLYLLDDRLLQTSQPHFPLLAAHIQQPAVTHLAHTLNRINPDVQAYGLGARLLYNAHAAAIPPCDLLIEATSDLQSKQICLETAQKRCITAILASVGAHSGVCTVHTEAAPLAWHAHHPFHDCPQGTATAQVIGGLAAGEARRCLLPLPGDAPPAGPICFDLAHLNQSGAGRNSTGQAETATPSPYSFSMSPLSQRHALVIGAGALGTWTALTLALAGIKQLTIVDPDVVAESNLNRQVLFFYAVGEPKARVLAARLRRLCPLVAIEAVVAPVAEAHVSQADLALLCVDNFATRALVNDMAVRYQRPLFNGGTGPFAGEVCVYRPGHTACLNCHLDMKRLAEAETGQRAGCAQQPDPAIVISNQITGGLLASAASLGDPPLAGILAYDAFHPVRLGLRSIRASCACHVGVAP